MDESIDKGPGAPCGLGKPSRIAIDVNEKDLTFLALRRARQSSFDATPLESDDDLGLQS